LSRSIDIYDTTLRDGCQAEDISLTLEDKLRITERLDDFGIAYVEGGWPGSNPRDEAYFDVRFQGASESIVSRPGMPERTVILYTFSKKYAMTGWRLGAAIGPQPIIDIITRMNVNMESCPNHFAQYGALEALTGDQAGPREMMARLKGRRDAALRILPVDPDSRVPERRLALTPWDP